MPNEEHVALLRKGVGLWNKWRAERPAIRPDLTKANLNNEHLRGADLSEASLVEADLRQVNAFEEPDLRGEVNFSGAFLYRVNLSGANLSEATLRKGLLSEAELDGTNLSRADLSGANLERARLVKTNLQGTTLTGCRIYGISAWELKLGGANQSNLIITPREEPTIRADNLEVAQFIYLLLNNQKIRDGIDTIGKKAVLILGRFTPEKRQAALDVIPEELRRRDYLPIVSDFEKLGSRDLTETISILAHMSRFVIADLTDPRSVPHELCAVVPHLRSIPIQLLLEKTSSPSPMLWDLMAYDWVLKEICVYDDPEQLLASLSEKVISPAEEKAGELEEKRKAAEERARKLEEELRALKNARSK